MTKKTKSKSTQIFNQLSLNLFDPLKPNLIEDVKIDKEKDKVNEARIINLNSYSKDIVARKIILGSKSF